MYHSVMQF
ncbi:hypothetical protein PENANT_c328G05200 [Penicillium antarcticum]|uniref:Uncharacterized protein n=1 Tax=Penicillium antarcticum TaxID=416450 RepID=A0A1V6NRD1_9EURO|nr:hypothetical protein PENANT_c328G05200 [Penicillium antarcticum]